MKKTETPSTPIKTCKFKEGNHSTYSKNWNLEVELSKKTNRDNEYKKAKSEVTKAHNFIPPTSVFGIAKIIKIPMNGINISHDNTKSNIRL